MEIEAKETIKSSSKNEHVQGSASGENAAPYPQMNLAQSIHQATLMVNGQLSSEAIQTLRLAHDLPLQVMTRIKEDWKNPSLLRHLAPILQLEGHFTTEDERKRMEEENEQEIERLEKAVEVAKEESGDMEVLDARMEVAKFAAKTMSKEKTLDMYNQVLALPKLSSGKKMDALMEYARVSCFYGDLIQYQDALDKVSLSW